MIEWIYNLDVKLQAVLISSCTSIFVLLLGWVIKVIYERTSLSYKLKKEFQFEQKKKLKEDIAQNKTPLLNIVEELNHRLWNFNENIEKNWQSINRKDWKEGDKYYTRSFVYRFLVFIHWTLKIEKDTLSIDTTIADKNDVLFLKYIKTFKDIFSEPKLVSDLGDSNENNKNHFLKNKLIGFSKWVVDDGRVIDFDEFDEKTRDKYDKLEKIILYFSKIKNTNDDKNLNTLRCFHLISICFLNRYGHDYQKTEKAKLKDLTHMYREKLMVKDRFKEFVIKSKLEFEMLYVLRKINNQSLICYLAKKVIAFEKMKSCQGMINKVSSKIYKDRKRKSK